ncbi:caspase family protein [Shinella curvata]|uniref:Caspase family protein n=1 Tax=Shinella curvata TaxID=1817964 RepID=A0ABT8XFU8_9HYPH|nr:caspase family protein [Shinella curvata]MCJ8053306.1 caspase family protein [Shinella curvata]MDO6122637.1 caspase family protein [Shinella curvata]
MQRNVHRMIGALVACLVLLVAPSAFAAERYALLIGNADYEDAEPLENPLNDIDLVGEALERAGFDVTRVTDTDNLAMLSALNTFTRRAEKAQDPVLFVYFSGYAVQLDGDNFLLPTDASGRTLTGLKNRSLPVSQVSDTLRGIGKGLKVVLFDAAHENPFPTLRDIPDGLAEPKNGTGIHYAYAAAPGTTYDYEGTPISPFASAFVDAISIPGIALEDAFRKVGEIVKERSKGKQDIWQSDADYGKFALSSKGDKVDDAEIAFYEFASLSDSREAYDRYLSRYPQGTFSTIAQRKIDLIGKRFEKEHEDTGNLPYLTFSNDRHDPCGRFSFNDSDRRLGDLYKDGQLALVDFRFWTPPESCDTISYFTTVYSHERLRNIITSAGIPERRIHVATQDDLSPSEERSIYDYFDEDRRGYAQSLMFRAINDERRHGFGVAVKTPDDNAREYVDEIDCGEGCLRLRGLVRLRDNSVRSLEDYELEFVDVRRFGYFDRYRDLLRDFPADDHASNDHSNPSSHQAKSDAYADNGSTNHDDGYGSDADPYRTSRSVGGWDIVADFGSDRRFLNCRATRRGDGDRTVAFRWYGDDHVTFGFQDTAYDYADSYASDAKYWIDDGKGYDVRGKAYGRQEIAYDLGSDRSVIEALKRGSRLRIGDISTSLKGSTAMLNDLQACVGAFH